MATFEAKKLMEVATRIREMREIFSLSIKEMAEKLLEKLLLLMN